MFFNVIGAPDSLRRFASSTRLDWRILAVFSKTSSTRRVLRLIFRNTLPLSMPFSSWPMVPSHASLSAQTTLSLFCLPSSQKPWPIILPSCSPIPRHASLSTSVRTLSQRFSKTPTELRETVKHTEQKGLGMLVDLFDWLDGCEPQPTTEIVALYERSQAIETKITNTLAQMDQAAAKMAEISKLVKAVQMNSVSLCFTHIWRSCLTFVGRRTCILFPTSK